MNITTDAQEYEPTGDPEHVAYGADFSWHCSCGRKSHYVTSKRKAKTQAHQHEKYCWENGQTTVDVL